MSDDQCEDERCRRPRGHSGTHAARGTDEVTGRDYFDEWGDHDLGAAPRVGDMFAMPEGEVRIDRVTADQVYFVSWRNGQEYGNPLRMTRALFAEAVRKHGAQRAPTTEGNDE